MTVSRSRTFRRQLEPPAQRAQHPESRHEIVRSVRTRGPGPTSGFHEHSLSSLSSEHTVHASTGASGSAARTVSSASMNSRHENRRPRPFTVSSFPDARALSSIAIARRRRSGCFVASCTISVFVLDGQ